MIFIFFFKDNIKFKLINYKNQFINNPPKSHTSPKLAKPPLIYY